MCPHDWLFQDKESGEWRGCPTPGLSTVSSGQCKFWILVSECWSVYSNTNFWLVQDSAANSNVFSKNQDSTLSKKPKLCSLPIRIMFHHSCLSLSVSGVWLWEDHSYTLPVGDELPRGKETSTTSHPRWILHLYSFIHIVSVNSHFPVFISTVWAEYPGGLEPEDQSCRTPLESNIQPQTVLQVRKCIPHWISYSEKSCSFLRLTLYLVWKWFYYDSILHAPLSGMRRQRGDTIFIFRAKKISDQSSVYLSSKLCISVISFISFIVVPCLPSTLERESRCDKACMIRS